MPPEIEVTVSVGNMANFTCGAVGSNVHVRWEFNNSTVCDCQSRSCIGGALCSSHTTLNFDPRNDNITTESVLKIDTGLLIRQASELEFHFVCIANQTVPRDVQGSRLHGIFTAALIIESKLHTIV